jgi:hypothetical protein
VLEYPQSGERIAVGITFRHPVSRNRTRNASLCGGYSALPTSGSPNWSSPTTGSRLTR